MDKRLLGEITLLFFGIFLIIDGLFIRSLSFKYETFGLQALDHYINHEYIRILFASLALIDMRASKVI